jgi:hypothetical protein
MYRIYKVTARTDHVQEGKEYADSYSSYLMPRDRKDHSAWKQAQAWWTRCKPGLGLVELKVQFSHEATWCPLWFAHWTWDTDESDMAVLASFHDYVGYMQEYNQVHGYWIGSGENRMWCDKLCLMGAEEHWRWRASKDDDTAPCRCEHCKKQGIIRICH